MFVTTDLPSNSMRRDVVDAARHQRGQVRQERAEPRVRAAVLQRLEPVREHLAVLRPADGEVELLRAAVRQRDHALAARLRPAHRPAELPRQPDEQDLLGVDHLRAEAAADVGGDHADVRRIEPEHPGEHHPVLMRRLRRQPGGDAAVGADLRGGRARLERARRHPLAEQRPGDDGVAAVEQLLVVLGRAGAGGDVRAGSGEEQRLVLRGVLRLDDDRQRVVVDEHELRGVRAGGAVVADHDGDDVADEADGVRGDERPSHALVEPGERRRPERRQVDVGAGEDLDAGKRRRGRGVDAPDAGVRQQRADEGDGGCALERQVLDVAALTAEEARVFLPQDAISEDAHRPASLQPGARPGQPDPSASDSQRAHTALFTPRRFTDPSDPRPKEVKGR